jgi:hypothetical protein
MHCLITPIVTKHGGEIVGIRETNMCFRASFLLSTAALKARKIDEATTIGEREKRLDAYKEAKQRFVDHIQTGV